MAWPVLERLRIGKGLIICEVEKTQIGSDGV